MKLTIYTADCTGVNDNCLYPHKVEATNAGELAEAADRAPVLQMPGWNETIPH